MQWFESRSCRHACASHLREVEPSRLLGGPTESFRLRSRLHVGNIRWLFMLLLLVSLSCQWSRAPAQDRTPSSSQLSLPGIPSQSFSCPKKAAYLAVGPLFYPPNYPFLPHQNLRPDRCFNSAAGAVAAGHHLAPPPAGASLVAGEYLVKAPAGLGATCRHAAAQLGVSVACPGIVPFGLFPLLPDPCAPCHGVFILDAPFVPTPPGYVALPNGWGHLVIWTIPDGARFSPCLNPQRVGSTLVSSHQAYLYQCEAGSEGEDAGHTDLQWRVGSSLFGISLHGYSAVNRAVDIAIARDVHIVHP
jgi:hypothetical protein